MATATLTIRTDAALKQQAAALFDELGMSLSTAINIFLKQAVIHRAYPCSIDSNLLSNAKQTYPANFFSLFGTDQDPCMVEPTDLPLPEMELAP